MIVELSQNHAKVIGLQSTWIISQGAKPEKMPVTIYELVLFRSNDPRPFECLPGWASENHQHVPPTPLTPCSPAPPSPALPTQPFCKIVGHVPAAPPHPARAAYPHDCRSLTPGHLAR